jgi:hypothetical protein
LNRQADAEVVPTACTLSRARLLTTVGFGDIHAVSTAARMVATFLSALGVLFPAIVIARLVGLASSRS